MTARAGGFDWRQVPTMLIKVLAFSRSVSFLREMAVSKFFPRSTCAGAPLTITAVAMLAFFGSVEVGAAQAQGNSQTAVTQMIANFKANPDQLLSQYPNAGPELVSRIR